MKAATDVNGGFQTQSQEPMLWDELGQVSHPAEATDATKPNLKQRSSKARKMSQDAGSSTRWWREVLPRTPPKFRDGKGFRRRHRKVREKLAAERIAAVREARARDSLLLSQLDEKENSERNNNSSINENIESKDLDMQERTVSKAVRKKSKNKNKNKNRKKATKKKKKKAERKDTGREIPPPSSGFDVAKAAAFLNKRWAEAE